MAFIFMSRFVFLQLPNVFITCLVLMIFFLIWKIRGKVPPPHIVLITLILKYGQVALISWLQQQNYEVTETLQMGCHKPNFDIKFSKHVHPPPSSLLGQFTKTIIFFSIWGLKLDQCFLCFVYPVHTLNIGVTHKLIHTL